jgi:hypothetical protein
MANKWPPCTLWKEKRREDRKEGKEKVRKDSQESLGKPLLRPRI